MDKYKLYCGKINSIYQRFTDMVEPFSIDESWLDVTASQSLFGSGRQIADTIRKTVKEELGMTLSAGVSYNKVLAKMGSEYEKPDATTIITKNNFREILWPLPARELFGVGKATSEKLDKLGIRTIGDIARADKNYLHSLFGKAGCIMWEYANGIDESPVCRYDQREPMKSVGNGVTFRRDLTAESDIATAVKALSGHGSRPASKIWIQGVRRKGRYQRYAFQSHFTPEAALCSDLAIRRNIKSIYGDNTLIMEGFISIRMITITGIDLTGDISQEQLSLFGADIGEKDRCEKMELTMDQVRRKYGSQLYRLRFCDK